MSTENIAHEKRYRDWRHSNIQQLRRFVWGCF